MKYFLAATFACGMLFLCVYLSDGTTIKKMEPELASALIARSATPAADSIHVTATDTTTVISPDTTATTSVTMPTSTKPFSILIVPGHDTNTGGAHYRDLYERDMVVDIADKISTLLSSDSSFKVMVARSKTAWNPILQGYFDSDKQAIIDFKNAHQAADKALMASGAKKAVPDMADHTDADATTSVELYGINKWAGENGIDLVIHLHLNDSGRKNMNQPGYYKGFTMFIPEKQMANATASRAIATDIYSDLKKDFTPETVSGRKDSLFEDQSLIAIGASGTLTKPAILIEYGYIYDKIFSTDALREKSYSDMAAQTVAGIRDYIAGIK